ncbi:kinase-interacting family protein isoform X1 [Carya illinoinensis]|uniref:NAB domain-containing protein n=2 Tax=Carya illinoinensis TaxID=32201 RepID=A0A8T1N5D1_CARIL|nr:kinase-interacting family protein isoform X1 [Carya illinoinensis]KAG6625091.1 hypothetical protein CIPAW_16G072100 [Carya illinoinensis]
MLSALSSPVERWVNSIIMGLWEGDMTTEKIASSFSTSDDQNEANPTPRGRSSFRESRSKPSWLLSTLSDLDARMMTLTMKTVVEDNTGDTFRERAESYYQKRPQLIALLQDLYNGYITLSDRYIQTLAKSHRSNSSRISAVDFDKSDLEEEDGMTNVFDSDAESSLSYQQPPQIMLDGYGTSVGDAIVADLVIKNVEYDILQHEMGVIEQRSSESSRKIDLQKSLLEVLESERLILLNENARLRYRVHALVDENKGLASESTLMKRKASELARCVLKMREGHRVFMLNRRIEDLQAQIYGLEKRNKEYYEQLVQRDQRVKECTGKKNVVEDDVVDDCSKREKQPNLRLKKGSIRGKKGHGWWKRFKNMDLFFCGLDLSCT